MRWQRDPSGRMRIWHWPLVLIAAPFILALMATFATFYAKRWLFGPYTEWRPWFAWHPIEMPWDGDTWPAVHERVWLEWVERRSGHPLGDVSYRAIAVESRP